MTTPSTSGEEGPTDPQVHCCQREGAEGWLGARKKGYAKLFRQETDSKLHQPNIHMSALDDWVKLD